VQRNRIEFHVWGSTRQQPDLPHSMIFDIDPDECLDFGDVKQAALDIRAILQAIELQSLPLLSGGKGFHVVIPLVPQGDWEQVKSFCQDFAELLARTDLARFIANMSERPGARVGYLRNGQRATAICPWSTRAQAGASCAVPVTWDELPHFESAIGFDVSPPQREPSSRTHGTSISRSNRFCGNGSAVPSGERHQENDAMAPRRMPSCETFAAGT
jgi:bifunctional non-homologous end joining protein LigD